ncbi:MAG: hypothetical protein V3V78_04920 [Candidatus Woesearchaeota archaeon]
MAKPIRSTPTLRGDEAVNFVKAMIKREKSGPTRVDKQIAKSLKKNWKVWTTC